MTNHVWILGITGLSLTIWLFLVLLWGRFWWADQRLEEGNDESTHEVQYPPVFAIIPARNEADVLPTSLKSLLVQDYPGPFSIILVDDQSTDGTGEVAKQVAESVNKSERLQVISGATLQPGWTGKLWAMEQGVRYAQQQPDQPIYFLFTDADIEHSQTNLRQLTEKAETDQLDLTSLMVLLRCESFWEKLLIPAFVFFFQMLYPFPWVNNPNRKNAAAAGGCILIRHSALERIGGIQILKEALIDDCSLAAAVKRGHVPSPPQLNPIWLGLTTTTISLRPYETLKSIWDMVARTAYTQLYYSPLLLIGTVLGMVLVYLVPPLGLIWALMVGQPLVALATFITWLLMALSYWPTLRLYRCSPLWAFCLPFIGFLYTLMTIDSAIRHWRGEGGAWKGRVYK